MRYVMMNASPNKPFVKHFNNYSELATEWLKVMASDDKGRCEVYENPDQLYLDPHRPLGVVDRLYTKNRA